MKKEKMKTATKFVAFSIVMIVLYAIFYFIILWKTGSTPSDVFTTCWFGAFTVELGLSANITKTKVKNHYYEQVGVIQPEEVEIEIPYEENEV